jgi:L-asparaginase
MVAQGRLVFICSQSPHGTVDLNLYESGRKALEAGAVPLGDMTLESALVKLMLAGANFSGRKKKKDIMMCPVAGELSPIQAQA